MLRFTKVRRLGRGRSAFPQFSYSTFLDRKKSTLHDIQDKYRLGKPITMVTAYDYTSAKLAESAEIDSILVGDSYSMVMAGSPTTVPATLDGELFCFFANRPEIIYHAKCVSQGANKTFIVGDMPFGSYEISNDEAVRNAFRLMKEGRVDAIKLEGGLRMKDRIKAIVSAGIPVMGHIGLTPQTISALGGFKVQGNTFESAAEIVKDAKHLQEAGCYALVIESVPQKISEYITSQLHIPTIGIGAGNKTSGQILVWHDMFGLFSDFSPKFNKRFANAGALITEGLATYKREVEAREFPTPQHSYVLKQEIWDQFAHHFKLKKRDSGTAVEPPTVEEVIQVLTKDTPKVEVVPEKHKYRIVIIGSGAMGSLVGARLARPNPHFSSEIWMVSSWREHVHSINKNGLKVEELGQDDNGQSKFHHIENVKATSSVPDILKNGPVDFIFILAKSPDTRIAAEKAKQLITPKHKTTVVTMQNGLGNYEAIKEIIHAGNTNQNATIMQAVTDQGAMMMAPGYVRHTGNGVTTLAQCQDEEVNAQLLQLFRTAGFEILVNNNLESVLWGKLVVNAGINPITALFNLDNGELMNNERGRTILKRAIDEAVAVAKAKGIVLPYGTTSEQAIARAESILRNTAQNKSSMLTDILRGVATEIDSINGKIVAEGEKVGVDVSFNRSLVELLRKVYRVNTDSEVRE